MAEQASEQEIAAAVAAQAAIDKVLNGRAGSRIDAGQLTVGQTLAGTDGGMNAGGLEQRVGEGIGRQTGHRPRLWHAA
jgi:hypothetical protein